LYYYALRSHKSRLPNDLISLLASDFVHITEGTSRDSQSAHNSGEVNKKAKKEGKKACESRKND
jgi:hypothetical protein